ncbi:hypothetical protein [Nocardia mangyaensis]|uniref:hypothetical protein n=1 Tax=Nocardia mangyaensis TaxID=2213200 RepID=UPI0012EB8B7D|nr:hypothetical protein [Nocardia mangyaensis]
MSSDLQPTTAPPTEHEEEATNVRWPEPSPLESWWVGVMAAPKIARRFGQRGTPLSDS